MRRKNMLSMIALSSILAACGSGGGQGTVPSGSNHLVTPVVPSTPSTELVAKNNASATYGKSPTSFEMDSLQIIDYDTKDRTISNYSTLFTYDRYDDSVYELTLDGVKIALYPKEGKYSATDTDTKVAAPAELNKLTKYVAFYQVSKKESFKYNHFFVGQPTADMPQNGRSVYKGKYQIEPMDLVNSSDQFQTGELSFNVDFGTKKVDAIIKDINFSGAKSNVNISANINGNKFSGDASLNNAAVQKGYANGYVKGRFFGPAAKEAGAIIGADNIIGTKKSWYGAFNGVKQ